MTDIMRLAAEERHRAELALDAHYDTCPIWPQEACDTCRELAALAAAAAAEVGRLTAGISARRDRQRAWRRRRGTSVGRYTLAICADGYGRQDLGPVVCGLPPDHQGPHHDVHWAVEWDLRREEQS